MDRIEEAVTANRTRAMSTTTRTKTMGRMVMADWKTTRPISYVNTNLNSGSDKKYEDILRTLKNTKGFGNDIDEIDEYSVRCGRIYCELVEQYRNPRGGKYQAGLYPVSANVLYGKDVDVLPTGCLAKEALADGVSPRAGVDTQGPTAAANSVSKLDHAIASNGTLYNMKFLPAAIAGDTGLINLASLIRGYFERKGMHIQFNVVDRQTLLDAQANDDRSEERV